MIGLCFNLAERYLVERHGDAALEAALDASGFAASDPWLDALNYPIEEFDRWLAACAGVDRQPLREFQLQLGRWAIPRLLRRYMLLADGYASPQALLADLQSTIVPQLKRMMFALRSPDFTLECRDDGALLRYVSDGRRCGLVEGLLRGLGEHYGTPLQLDHSRCVARGDASCDFAIGYPARQTLPDRAGVSA